MSSTGSRHVDPDLPSVELLDPWLLAVVLIGDLADDLLEDVLDRDQTGSAAVLINDDRHMHLLRLHVAQQLVDRLGLRDEVCRPHHVADPLRGLRPRRRRPCGPGP